MQSAKHRTQILLEHWQYEKLCEISHITQKSISTIIRDLISDKYLRKKSSKTTDPIMDVIGIGSGDGSSVAQDHDEFLYGTKQ